MTPLEKELEVALLGLYEQWKRSGAPKNFFLQMVKKTKNKRLYKGPIGTVRHLLNKAPAAGFVSLVQAGNLDLTVEALILDSKWKELFSSTELDEARSRIAAARHH
jgi:hypothetical protein